MTLLTNEAKKAFAAVLVQRTNMYAHAFNIVKANCEGITDEAAAVLATHATNDALSASDWASYPEVDERKLRKINQLAGQNQAG